MSTLTVDLAVWIQDPRTSYVESLADTSAEVSIVDTAFARKVGCYVDRSQIQDCVGIGDNVYTTEGRTRLKTTLAGSLVYFFDIWVGDLAGQEAILAQRAPAVIQRQSQAHASESAPTAGDRFRVRWIRRYMEWQNLALQATTYADAGGSSRSAAVAANGAPRVPRVACSTASARSNLDPASEGRIVRLRRRPDGSASRSSRWGGLGGLDGVDYRDCADPSVANTGFPETSAAQVEGVGPKRRSSDQEPGSGSQEPGSCPGS
ncbi:hypothetical protein ON010_g6830 [Phytophthora cinnamomi]|nr:hypothetical protein ON010_g6830 [Phytophthora cinnamomi]